MLLCGLPGRWAKTLCDRLPLITAQTDVQHKAWCSLEAREETFSYFEEASVKSFAPYRMQCRPCGHICTSAGKMDRTASFVAPTRLPPDDPHATWDECRSP